MHRVLTIHELIQHIFGCLNDHFSNVTGSGNERTLSALARTCQTFKEPALNVLWEKIASLDPLIKCLPKDAWKVEEDPEAGWMQQRFMPIFARPLTEGDWLIIREYAPRVRRFCMTGLHRSYSDVMFELSLASRDMHPLFPNLKHLEWISMPSDFRPYLRMFLPAALESLTYIISSRDEGRADISMLAAIGTFCPGLKEVTVDFSDVAEGGVEAFSRSVGCWKDLTILRCGWMTDAALIHIASSPTLRKLSITLPSVTSFRDVRSQIEGEAFKNLTTLRAIAVNLDVFTAFATHMELSLVDVTLWIVENDFSESAKDSFMALASGSRSLLSLHVASYDDSAILTSSDYFHAVHGRTATISTFEPLFKFQQLRVLDLSVRCSLKLDDHDVIELAHSFPLLEGLLLNADYGWGVPSSVTFIGLSSVVNICPKLNKLAIEFDATAASLDLNQPTSNATSPNATIRTLLIGNSQIDDPIVAARALFTIFPNLNRIEGWSSRRLRSDDHNWMRDRRRFTRRWDSAQLIIHRLRSRNPTNIHEDESFDDLVPSDSTDVSEDDDTDDMDDPGDDFSEEDQLGLVFDDDDGFEDEASDQEFEDENVEEDAFGDEDA
ncbi:hypothetical protein CONPUDRAFT_164584 [Coniophora puteana RWD-64-598 SS2]|uniref:F-box domain-containing protein n=1 Tax=Coniophora puteana (strain RWD-64-598) TaxID=741705 RepID=A0A5M3MSV5_CONPW|nr:uncharacterized protein CONPUDRAFT_164584 [Coniophora puteana RWD-64-598 SS2]EIW81824.1 hypothetical protein CONPUDRAFT_164584 [Coniophora puteana RWD-64-598 SS2]